MKNLSHDTIRTIISALAVIGGAFVAGILGMYSALRIKQLESRIDGRKKREKQKLKFYLPLLRFTTELDKRIQHILSQLDSDWLRSSHLEKIRRNEGFVLNPNEKGYFIITSIYMISCFFGWAEAIKRDIDTTKAFAKQKPSYSWLSKIKRAVCVFLGIPEKKNIFLFDPDITTVSRLFQYEELFKDYITSKKLPNPKDACKLHKQIQYSIGELMLEKDGHDIRCKTFREFVEAYKNEKFRYWFILLENLLIDLSDFENSIHIETQVEKKNDIRPLRLLAIRYWCRVLMKNMSKDLEIETSEPQEVLEGISEDLKKIIKSFKIEKSESYLLGVKITSN